VLGSALALSEDRDGASFSTLRHAHDLRLERACATFPEYGHRAVTRFLREHTRLSSSAAIACNPLVPNRYKLNASAWQHAHSLLAHTALQRSSSLLSNARAQYEGSMSRDCLPFDRVLQGASSSASPLPLQGGVSDDVLQLLAASLADLWFLMQVTCDL
jgi:hypothetical protein